MSKASKQRMCPALGRNISSAECGEGRQSRIACTPECPFNIFGPANYSQLLEIEDRLDAKTMERLTATAPDRAQLEIRLDQAHRQGLVGAQAFYAWNLFFATGPDNQTFARRWEVSRGTELRNDERVLLRAKMQMRVALLEVRRVLPGAQVEVVDLLSPHSVPVILQDRNLAAVAVRFSTFLAWVYPLPHYWRSSGTARFLPDVAQFTAAEIVTEIVRHLGGLLTEPEMRRWLAEHFLRVDAALLAVSQKRRQQMLDGLDAKWSQARYELRDPFDDCVERLDRLADVGPEALTDEEMTQDLTEARVWFDPKPPQSKQLTPADGRMVLGRVLLGPSVWRLETFGAEKFLRLRAQFEKHMGARVRFSGERVDDLGARMAAKEPVPNESLVPPRLLENPDRLLLGSSQIPMPPPGTSLETTQQEIMRAAERAFLDESIPALDHRTPREAAQDLILRPRLIHLMKQRVRSQDERNLETGQTEDMNWMLQELGLTEIIFDAPPQRPPPPRIKETLAEEAEGWLDPFDTGGPFGPLEPDRPPAPRLPDKPLSMEEVLARLQKARTLFPGTGEAEDEVFDSGATIIEDAEELTLTLMSEAEFSAAVPYLLEAWFALVPPGSRAPAISYERLKQALDASAALLVQAINKHNLNDFMTDGPQPDLMTWLGTGILRPAKDAPTTDGPVGNLAVTLALLKAVVEVLDEALRRE